MYVPTERGISQGVYKGGWMPVRDGIAFFVGVPYDAKGPANYVCPELSQSVPSPGYSIISLPNGNGQYDIYVSKSGSINVTRDDESFEGTFNFTAKHTNSEKTITISDGKFKLNKLGK